MNINIKQMRKDVRKNIYENKFNFYVKATDTLINRDFSNQIYFSAHTHIQWT